MNSFLGTHLKETLPSSGGSGNDTHQNHFRVLWVQGKGRKIESVKTLEICGGFVHLIFLR